MRKKLREKLKTMEHLKWYEKIGYLRRLQRITKKEMMTLCCTYMANYIKWEKGRVYPRKYNQRLIAKALNVRVSDIFVK